MKGLSELIGLNNLISETMHVKATMTVRTDSSACKGMILRHGTGKDKKLPLANSLQLRDLFFLVHFVLL